ncbi:hypothetical protein L3X38_006995 [Prunus dulcis]|uniref:Uncharacterized protein n=1 Tax=Prunus dulcis TaxID=3755 RepID=A0AAD4ZTP6_PRUDU|nr:hypothetical protein L3X38_006995 [Prunus dulcis]
MIKVVSHPNHHRTMVFPNFNEPVPAENPAGEALRASTSCRASEGRYDSLPKLIVNIDGNYFSPGKGLDDGTHGFHLR